MFEPWLWYNKPMSQSTDKIIDYYHTKESLWGYKLILGGTKHFGYYPKGSSKISMKQAMVNMADKMGETLDLPPNSKVLDAGCGEGSTAMRLADKYKLKVTGVDLLDFNIATAKRKASESSLTDSLSFKLGNYLRLDYPDNSFDGLYTMETLVHAPDYKAALKEFKRVLKPGGRIVLFEYSMPSQDKMNARERQAFKIINEGSVMYSYPYFVHGRFTSILEQAGFQNVKTKNITDKMLPMLKRFWQMGVLPYQIIKLAGKRKKYVNTTAGVELYKYRKDFKYNIITATK